MKVTSYEDKKIVDKYFKKTLAAVYINYPAFLNILKSVKGKTVLDLGCGAGWLAGEISKKGAHVFAIDNSRRWIDVCGRQNGKSKNLKFACCDAADLKRFKNSKFDVVVANMVFLAVSSKNKLKKMFMEAARVLKKRGLLIFSDCHPIINMAGKTFTKMSGALKGFSYFDEGAKYKSKYLLSDYSPIEFVDSHWSLGFYSRLLKENGFVIEEIIEPKPVRLDLKKKPKDYKFPEYIIFKCKKL